MATIEPYLPAPPPRQVSLEVQQYLDHELRRIADVLNQETVFLPPLAVAPAKPSDGMIAYADGTNWNPGSGAGFYGYQAGAWVKL